MCPAAYEPLRDHRGRVRPTAGWTWAQVWKHNGGKGMQDVRDVGRDV